MGTKTYFIFCMFFALNLAACSNDRPSKFTKNNIATDTLHDIDYICRLVPQKYAYYKSRESSWQQACEQAKTQGLTVVSKQDSLAVFEHLLDALYDSHASLGTNSGQSPRLTPSGSDLWLEWNGPDLPVIAIRSGGGANKAGIKIGDKIISIHGQKPKDAALERITTNREYISDKRMNWATNAAAAGYRNIERSFDVLREGEVLSFKVGDPEPIEDLPPISHRIMNSNIGYFKFNNSLGNSQTVKAFENALGDMKKMQAWILDLRDTPGGGNTDIAEPIMGRFLTQDREYQTIVEIGNKPYNRKIPPQGPETLNGPVIILVGRWTGSMGEGMAIGFDGMGRGNVLGSPMAGLAGGTNGFTLPSTGIPVWFPTYDLAHLDGTPRYLWQPETPQIADSGEIKDSLLAKAIDEIAQELR